MSFSFLMALQPWQVPQEDLRIWSIFIQHTLRRMNQGWTVISLVTERTGGRGGRGLRLPTGASPCALVYYSENKFLFQTMVLKVCFLKNPCCTWNPCHHHHMENLGSTEGHERPREADVSHLSWGNPWPASNLSGSSVSPQVAPTEISFSLT